MNSIVSYLFLLTATAVYAVDGKALGMCKSDHSCAMEDLGCFKDHVDRAMPEEILNERDPTSLVYGGRLIDWHDYENWLSGFACRCAKIAANKGYEVIGLQFYGECWSSPRGHLDYAKYGESENCISGDFRLISETRNKSSCIKHIGSSWTNNVYRIGTKGCTGLNIEPIGCFHDDLIPPRPVPNYIMNERDPTNEGWNGRLIEWYNWINYSPEMICRCASEASKRKDDYFAIQFWGECWSGKLNEVDYRRNDGSDQCYNEEFQKCKCNSFNCVGAAHTNYVYRLHHEVTCPTSSPSAAPP